MTRLMKMNASEWHLITFGCIMALLQGAVQPAFALIFGEMLGVSYGTFCFLPMHVKASQTYNFRIFYCV